MTAPTSSSPEDAAGHALAGHRSSAAGRQLGPARLIYPRGGAYRGFDPGTGRWYPSGNVGLVVRPKRISVGNEERILISGIRWRGWGSRTAVGTGRARVCFASGCDAPYAGRVRLGGLRRSYCERNPNYYRVYTTIRLRLPGGGFGSPLRISPGIYC